MYVTRKVTFRSGTEGPRHDPYHYDETTITTPGLQVTFHCGLSTYLMVNGNITRAHTPDERRELWQRFAELTGGTPEQWQHWQARRDSKCRQCGNKRLTWVAGHPGETLKYCGKCHHVAATHFDRSVVE